LEEKVSKCGNTFLLKVNHIQLAKQVIFVINVTTKRCMRFWLNHLI